MENQYEELTKEEIEEIKGILQSLRPSMLDRKEYQYSYDIEKKIQTFVYSYEFLVNLVASIKTESTLNKLNVYIKEFKHAYEKYYYLTQLHKISLSGYGKAKIIKQMIQDYKQDASIEILISFMRPLGKRIQMFNPDEMGGNIL